MDIRLPEVLSPYGTTGVVWRGSYTDLLGYSSITADSIGHPVGSLTGLTSIRTTPAGCLVFV